MKVIKSGTVPSQRRSAGQFTGAAFGDVIHEPVTPEEGSRVNLVLFEPGARTWWHRHGRGQTIYNPWHYVPVLARKPGALRNGAPFKDWVLPASLERVRRKLSAVRDGNRQMVDILTAVLSDGLPAVEAACAEALAHGVYSADVVLNILARRRDPEPTEKLLTPASLTLEHEPAADCARYDHLRRTN